MDDIFIERNSVKPTPKIGINYTKESLDTTISGRTANEIADFIVSVGPEKFCLIDFFSGIGSATLAFLEKKHIRLVVSFERHKAIRTILKNNIYMYGEKLSSKSLVQKYQFNDDLSNYKGAVLFFNLNNIDKEDYETVKELIKPHFHSFFIYDESKSFKISYEKWKIETKVFDNYNIIYSINPNSDFSKSKWGLKNKPDPDLLTDKYVPQFQEEEKIEVIKNPVTYDSPISWKKFCAELTPCNPRYTLKEKLLEYQKYLKSVLTRIVPNESDANAMLTEEFIPYWILAITHETYNLTSNYEKLEIHGDSILDYCMKNYLLQRFPKIELAGLAEFKARYMSKEFQHIFASDMKFDTWVLLDGIKMNTKIAEDMFESFCGALLTVGNKIVPCLGIAYVQNFLTLVLSDVVFDMSWIYGKPKTALQQRGTMLRLGDFVLQDEDSDEEEDENEPKKKEMKGGIFDIWIPKTKTVKIEMTDRLIEYLKDKLGKQFNNPLVTMVGPNKHKAEDDAWKKALDILTKAGYTAEFAQEQRAILSFSSLDSSLVKKAKKKAANSGISQIFLRNLNKKSTEGTGRVFVLQGIRDGEKVKLAISSGIDEISAKTAVLMKYLES